MRQRESKRELANGQESERAREKESKRQQWILIDLAFITL